MKLPLSLVWDMLTDHYAEPVNLPPDSDRFLSAPALWAPGIVPDRTRLYLSSSPVETLEAGGFCLIYTDGARPVFPSALCISVDAPLGEVFYSVSALWDQTEYWRDSLDAVVLSGGNLRDLMQTAKSVLRNPIAVYGRDLSLRAQAGLEELPEEWNVFDPDNDDLELFTSLQRDLSLDWSRPDGKPFILPSRVLPYRTYNLALCTGEKNESRITAFELSHPFRASDRWALEVLEPYISCMLAQNSQAHGEFGLHTLLTRVLTDRSADERELGRQLTQLGWPPEDRYQCLVLTAGPGSSAAARLDAFLERMFPNSSCLYLEDKLVCYIHLCSDTDADDLYGKMKYFIRENFLKAGYSRVMKGHANLRRQFDQSCAALELGQAKSPHVWIHRFDALAFDYLLEQSVRHMACDLVCHEGVLRLYRHDRERGTAYIHTLRVFLDTNMNAVQTARELFIHRSTLLYRVEHIRDLLEDSLDNPDERAYIAYSLRLLEREEAKTD